MWQVLSLQILGMQSKDKTKGKSTMSYSFCSLLSLGCETSKKGKKKRRINLKSSLSIKCG